MIVYCIENVVNGKRYIGVTTTDLSVRWLAHVSRALSGSKTALSCAIRKYGKEAFVIEQVASIDEGGTLKELFALERNLIASHNTLVPRGYNMTAGGEGTIGYRYSEAQKAKIRGRKHSAETRAKMSASRKGGPAPWKDKKLSEQHKARMKEAWTPEKRAVQRKRMLAILQEQLRGPDGRMQSREIH